jgi:exoribonuclease R
MAQWIARQTSNLKVLGSSPSIRFFFYVFIKKLNFYLNRILLSNMSTISTFQSNATIELHGGTLMANVENGRVFPIKGNHLIPGDLISFPDETLLSRTEQPAIGIVSESGYLYITTLPPCDFKMILDTPYEVGTRIVLWFHSNGSYTIHGTYSSLPTDDVPCLLKTYQLTMDRDKVELEPLGSSIKQSLYTLLMQDETHLDTFTIDPEHSLDLDDAISINTETNTIYIHIVQLSGLTEEENRRLRSYCFSLYLSNEHTEHLLDSETATNRLSLVSGQHRNVITVKVSLDTDGLVTSYDIYPSKICVKHRYHYQQVQEMIQKEDCRLDLKWLQQMSNIRSSAIRYQIQLPSIRFTVNKEGYIPSSDAIHTETMDDSHTMISTAMILANMIVSQHLDRNQKKLPNRFHEKLRGSSRTKEFRSSGNLFVDSFITVKKLARAVYDIDQRGHFGLGLQEYVHFTSPMRRYADVLVQRILSGECFTNEDLEKEISWLNQRSSICKTLQHLYSTWKIGRFVMSEIRNNNCKYDIWLTSVKKSGVMWFMPSLSLNGFTHVSGLRPTQYWKWNQDKETLEGKHVQFYLGKQCIGTIQDIDPITFTIKMNIE